MLQRMSPSPVMKWHSEISDGSFWTSVMRVFFGTSRFLDTEHSSLAKPRCGGSRHLESLSQIRAFENAAEPGLGDHRRRGLRTIGVDHRLITKSGGGAAFLPRDGGI